MAPDSGERTRASLRQATTEIIAQRGWGSVTTRTVAERAGVRPGVVHYHFDSIEDLKRDAAIAAINELVDPFIAAANQLTPREILIGAGTSSVEEFGPGTDESNLIYEVLLAAHRDQVLQSALRDVLVRFRAALAERIRACHPHLDDRADLLAGLFAAAIDGLQLHLLASPGLDLVAHLEPLLDLLGPDQPMEAIA